MFLGTLIVMLTLVLPTAASVQISKEGTATPSSASPEANLPEIARFSTTDGAWEIAITLLEQRESLRGQVAEGMWVVAFFTVTNTSTIDDSFPYRGLGVIDAQGNEYPADYGDYVNLVSEVTGESSDEPIASGETIETAIMIDVPADATGLTLIGPGWPDPVAIDR
jgi:hypothetical protein